MKAALDGATKAAEKLGIKRPKIYGVSVLTSFTSEEYLETLKGALGDYFEIDDFFIKDQVLNLARLTSEAGLDGLVCSSAEVKYVKKSYPELLTVVPGIKHPKSGKAGATQNPERVATPSNAIKWGADYLVIGSAIHDEDEPRQALMDIIEDIEGI
jgi:orotidine-5'-phosphate decarboxylase